MRRLFFAASAFYAIEHLWLSLSVIFTSSLITMTLIFRNPFATRLGFQLEKFNEICLLAIQYHLLAFTDFVRMAETRVKMGYSLVAVTLFIILINLLVNFFVIYAALRL